jgi:NTE family protein
LPVPNLVPKPIVDRLSNFRYAQAFDIFLRSVDVTNRAMAEYRLRIDRPDIIIHPHVSHIDLLDHVDIQAVVREGEQAVDAVLPELRQMSQWTSRLRRKYLWGRR